MEFDREAASNGNEQLPQVLMAIVFIVAIIRMPDHLASIIITILDGFKRFSFLGYVIAAAVTTGWWKHVRELRKDYEDRINKRDKEI